MTNVVIVGASFAGLSAAFYLSRAGISPQIIERRAKPAAHTTGGLADSWFRNMDFEGYPSEAVSAQIKGIRIVSPSGKDFVYKSPKSAGVVIDPEKWVEYYVDKVKKMGANFLAPATFARIVEYNGRMQVEYKDGEGIEHLVPADVVIAADGANSGVRRFFGIPPPNPDDLHIGYEETVPNPLPSTYDPELIELFIDMDVAKKGYCWIFPSENGRNLRVGLGIPKSLGQNPKDNLDRFLQMYPDLWHAGPVSKIVAGQIPTAPVPETNTHRYGKTTVLITGDAGNFCSPLHGGGIGFGIMSGVLAAKAVVNGDLRKYDLLWKKELGPILKRHYALKKMIYLWDANKFDQAIDALSEFDFEPYTQDLSLIDPSILLVAFTKFLILHHPRLIPGFVRVLI